MYGIDVEEISNRPSPTLHLLYQRAMYGTLVEELRELGLSEGGRSAAAGDEMGLALGLARPEHLESASEGVDQLTRSRTKRDGIASVPYSCVPNRRENGDQQHAARGDGRCEVWVPRPVPEPLTDHDIEESFGQSDVEVGHLEPRRVSHPVGRCK